MNDILKSFGLEEKHFSIQRLNSGYINATYKLKGHPSFILQRINKNIFTKPEVIASNLRAAANYLKQYHPEYLFISPQPTVDGREMSYDADGYPWRLFKYIENTITLDKVGTEEEAYSAAAEFARLTSNLDRVDLSQFRPSIARFHDLAWRYEQFQQAVNDANSGRLKQAREAIDLCQSFSPLVDRYNELILGGSLRLRITHNDTKINNILVDATSRKAIGVIDLDTLMPGYFIYDAGDMIRTFVSPVNEEEKDLNTITFRKNIYDALVAGYLSQMADKLTPEEKKLFPFAGQMMTYIMALRILADFLNGDVYYRITYPMQNFWRAKNQLKLLEILSAVGS